MEPWLQSALGYFRNWVEFQSRASPRPGCIVAVAHRGKVVAEYAFGLANLATGEKLTPRHRFRIASHSKSFTAAGIMKLRERRKLRLDDPVGQYVKGLHPQVAETTIAQILSHSAGLTATVLPADSTPTGGRSSAPKSSLQTSSRLQQSSPIPASNIRTMGLDCSAL